MNSVTAHLHWQREPGLEQVEFFAEGMHCANCERSIRSSVGALPGVKQVGVNLTTARVSVAWDPRHARLGTVLDTVERLGFRPVPLSGAAGSAAQGAERRRALKRIGLAGLAAMQMSMYTVGLYAGALSGIDPWISDLLRVTAMLIAVPVMLYAGAPFLRGAWHDLRRRSLGMDVPVAAALLLAFVASVANTWRGSGQIYFDSVAMFIFFLLAGRYVEMNVRRGSLNAGEALVRSLPAQVTRLREAGGSERVPLEQIGAGDRLVVPLGAVVPVDGVLESGATLIDESLLTGEAVPVTRATGQFVPGGAINLGAAATLRAACAARASTLASLAALVERAQSERPPQARAADRAAGRFVLWILVLAAAVLAFWLWFDPARAFETTLAVLVVTCPCALSLATPVTIAAATTRLARRGVLVTRADALERLAAVDTVVLDKTGTLTRAGMRLGEIHCLGGARQDHVLAVAASLEQHSGHPLAAAFTGASTERYRVSEPREAAGQGVQGTIDGTVWRLGRRDFVAAMLSQPDGTLPPVLVGAGASAGAGACAGAGAGAAADRSEALDEFVWLGCAAGYAAAFALSDTLRPEARTAIATLRALGLAVRIASGDRNSTVAGIAAGLGISEAAGRLQPEAKLALINSLQQQGRRVLMVGDGVNDGPVLAAAHVSCAMGGGAAIAHAAADLLLMTESLPALAAAIECARGAARLVRANLHWALGYNLCAVPLAAAGLVSPWLAALGMSASSLWVVARARRFAADPA